MLAISVTYLWNTHTKSYYYYYYYWSMHCRLNQDATLFKILLFLRSSES